MGGRLTVLDVVQKSADFLERKSVENARLNAEWLAAYALGIGRMELYLQFDRPLQEDELSLIRGYVTRRGKREPLQYIVGQTSFHDLTLKCDSRALIPRPETEQLVEFIKDSGPEIDEDIRILDLGTGGGAIALSLAMHFPRSKIVATDESRDALELAKENSLQSGLQNRVDFRESNWLEGIEPAERFNIIVSNPPYLTRTEMDEAEPEVNQFEPESALVSANDGLEDALRIIEDAIGFLEPGGSLWLETGIDQRDALLEACQRAGYSTSQGLDDWSGRARFVQAIR